MVTTAAVAAAAAAVPGVGRFLVIMGVAVAVAVAVAAAAVVMVVVEELTGAIPIVLFVLIILFQLPLLLVLLRAHPPTSASAVLQSSIARVIALVILRVYLSTPVLKYVVISSCLSFHLVFLL